MNARILENARRSVANSDWEVPEGDLERPSVYNPHHSYAVDVEVVEVSPAERRACREREDLRRRARAATA